MTGTLEGVFVAAVVFVASHILLSSEPLRPTLVRSLGLGTFRGFYATFAIAAFVWLAVAFATAPEVVLWPTTAAARYVPLVVMPVATILAVGGLTTRNPLAVGGEALPETADPVTGILKVTRHPFLWGLGLWAVSHIPPNGDAAALIFFGALAGLAFAGMPLIDRRRERELGAAWGPIALTTSVVPFAAIAAGRAKLNFAQIGTWRILAGVAVYLAFLLAHPWIAGVSALPA